MTGYLGASGFCSHDASFSFVDKDGNIEGCYEAERFQRVKHAPQFPKEDFDRLYDPNRMVVYNEDWDLRFETSIGFREEIVKRGMLRSDKGTENLYRQFPTEWSHAYSGHPQAHACAAFMTRPKSFDKEECVIVTVDGVGENQTMVIFDSDLNIKNSVYHLRSVGYLYAAFTEACGMGLKRNNDEYVVMGLASYGEPTNWEQVYEAFYELPSKREFHAKELFGDYRTEQYLGVVNPLLTETKNVEDAASSLQFAVEQILLDWMREARKYGSKLCYSGGVAQNIVANTKIAELFDDVWIDVNPGDAGASLGAAGWAYWKDTGNDRLNWEHPFLGHEIEGTLDPSMVVDYLIQNKVCGVANGRAEFSPRAYGNRSLIADVRYDVKDTVNTIKRRQKYRPFAPAILEEHAEEYFEGRMGNWMQFVAKAKHNYSSVTHVDGTGRVQLVPKDCKSVFRQIIELYYEKTGVPMLLNTSLNIRGKPMVNNLQDAWNFEEEYGVKVFTS